MALVRVTVPAVVLVRPTPPSKMAETEPFCISKAVVLVSMPPLPVILPPVNCTPATVSLLPAMLSVPPETFMLAVLSMTSLAPKTKVPACTSVRPV